MGDFKHLRWHVIYDDFWCKLKGKLENAREFPANDKGNDDDFKRTVASVAHKNKSTLHGLIFEKSGKSCYVAYKGNSLRYGLNTEEKKEERVNWENSEFDFTNDNILKLIKPEHRKEIIKELFEQMSELVTSVTNK